MCSLLAFSRLLLEAPGFLIRYFNVIVTTDKPRTSVLRKWHTSEQQGASENTDSWALFLLNCATEGLDRRLRGTHVSVTLGQVVLPKKPASEAEVSIYLLSSLNNYSTWVSVPRQSLPHHLLISTMSEKMLIHQSLIFSPIWNMGVRIEEFCLLGQVGTQLVKAFIWGERAGKTHCTDVLWLGFCLSRRWIMHLWKPVFLNSMQDLIKRGMALESIELGHPETSGSTAKLGWEGLHRPYFSLLNDWLLMALEYRSHYF